MAITVGSHAFGAAGCQKHWGLKVCTASMLSRLRLRKYMHSGGTTSQNDNERLRFKL